MKKIAVVGAGIYGCMVAVKLAEKKHKVDLYEMNDEILMGATESNQYRIHAGYHFPRSLDTAASSKNDNPEFLKFFKEAVSGKNSHYYAIAKENSLIDKAFYIDFAKKANLHIKETELKVIDKDKIQGSFLGKENLFDVPKARKIFLKLIKKLKINLYLNKKFDYKKMHKDYDVVVLATYSSNNLILKSAGLSKFMREYQFELCEKPLVKLPKSFNGTSVVILDGPFASIDPVLGTDKYVLGNVVHAIHYTNVGHFPKVPAKYKPFLDKGLIKNPKITNFPKFVKTAEEFFPTLKGKGIKHIGSRFTVRTVKPRVGVQKKTASRLIDVARVGDKVIDIFSGKLVNSISAYKKVLELVENWDKN